MRLEKIDVVENEVIITKEVFESNEELLDFMNNVTTYLVNVVEYVKSTLNVTPRAIRLKGFKFKPINVRDLDDSYVGKLVTVRGVVTNVSRPTLIPIEAKAICHKCKAIEVIRGDPLFSRRAHGYVRVCDEEKRCCCDPSELDYDTTSVFASRVFGTLQDVPLLEGNVKEVTFEAIGNIVNEIEVGKTYVFIGVLIPRMRRKGTLGLTFRVLDVQEDVEEVECDKSLVERARKDPYHLWKMVLSLSDKVFGRFNEKLALLLAMVNGCSEKRRKNVHVLFVGDPGVGKSVLMREVGKYVKMVSVSGKGASGVGLTVSMVKDEEGWKAIAGALPLASGGVLVIDEIDKLDKSDVQAIHTAMEQQVVEVAKAGKIIKLKVDTSIVAGGNPKASRYDPSKPLIENVKVDEALLSRFDLIFVMRQFQKTNEHSDPKLFDEGTILTILKDSFNVPYSVKEMKCFIKVARELCPKFTHEAMKALLNVAKELRERALELEMSGTLTPIPITPRDVESLKRIASAIAKLKLKDKVEVEDVELAFKLYEYMGATMGFEFFSSSFDAIAMKGKVPITLEKLLEEVVNVAKAHGSMIDLESLYNEVKEIAREANVRNVNELKKVLKKHVYVLHKHGLDLEDDMVVKLG